MQVIGWVPTGWTYENKRNMFPVKKKGNCSIHLVPYSEHSSYSELQTYVKFLRPHEASSHMPSMFCGSASHWESRFCTVGWYHLPPSQLETRCTWSGVLRSAAVPCAQVPYIL